jgi:hypothetical protein
MRGTESDGRESERRSVRILSDIVRRIDLEFEKGGDRQKMIEEIKAVTGAEAYVNTMERIIANGDATVERNFIIADFASRIRNCSSVRANL